MTEPVRFAIGFAGGLVTDTEGDWVSYRTYKAEIERLRLDRRELATTVDGQVAVIGKLRDEIERLREANIRLQSTLAADPTDQLAEIDRLCSLVYAYPPSEPFATDGVTWQQEAERLRLQSCQCGEDEACKYVQEIERLKAEIERRDEGIAQKAGWVRIPANAGPGGQAITSAPCERSSGFASYYGRRKRDDSSP